MLATTLHTLRRAARRLDRDEDGAILLAALASCMILFMLSLVLYDVGNLTREKVKLQTATDAAAYSQAAIKARTMNVNAYTNVAKRSIVGLHTTYHASFSLFYRVIANAAMSCSIDPSNPDQLQCQAAFTPPCGGGALPTNPGALLGSPCSGDSNWEVAFQESTGDWDDIDSSIGNSHAYGGYAGVYPAQSPVSGTNTSVGAFRAKTNGALVDRLNRASAVEKYNKELRQLTRYQEYMQKITPWWSFSEAVTRAAHNGATIATSYPPPPNLSSVDSPFNQLKNSVTSVAGNFPKTNQVDWRWQDDMYGTGRQVSLATNMRKSPAFASNNDVTNICTQLNPTTPGAFDPKLGSSPYSGRDEAFNAEMLYNAYMQATNSEATATDGWFATAAMLADDSGLKIIGGYSLCIMSHLGILSGKYNVNPYQKITSTVVPVFDPEYSGPYLMTIERDADAISNMRLSNIVFAYREGVSWRDGQERMNFMTEQYQTNLPDDAQGTGLWTMARSEIVTIGVQSGEWHSNWTARLRPIALPGELNQLSTDISLSGSNSFINAAFHDAFDHFTVNYQLVLGGSIDPIKLADVWTPEFRAMERATRTMDNNANSGVLK